MGNYSSKYLIEKEITVKSGNNSIVAQSLFINLEFNDNILFKVNMAIEVDMINLLKFKESQFFNLTNESLNGHQFPNFNADKKIEINAFLNPECLDEITHNSAKVFIDEFILNDKFNNESQWFWDTIKQEETLPEDLSKLGSLSSGLKSNWISKIYKSVKKVESPLFKDIYNFFIKGYEQIEITEYGRSFEFDMSIDIPGCKGELLLLEFKKIIIFYINIPFNKNWNEVVQTIGEINYDLPVGNFEYNQELNIVRFKTFIDYQDVNVTYPMLQNLYQGNFDSVSKYISNFQ